MNSNSPPQIIQGGMGVTVSGWPLARAVSCLGQLGVVSADVLRVLLPKTAADHMAKSANTVA